MQTNKKCKQCEKQTEVLAYYHDSNINDMLGYGNRIP